MIDLSRVAWNALDAVYAQQRGTTRSSLVDDAVEGGQYQDAEQAALFLFAEHFTTFDTAAKGGDPDGKVSQEDIEAVAYSAPGEFPEDLVEFARYLLSSGNAPVLDRLDKGSGQGGDDGDVVWQDVANVLKLEEAPARATSDQQAHFVDLQIQAILNADAEGKMDVVEVNEALALVLDDAPVDDPAFATALVEGTGSEALVRILDLARYAGIADARDAVVTPLQRLFGAAAQTAEGAAALNELVDAVIGADNMLPRDIDGILSMILGSSEYGSLPTGMLAAIADAGLVNLFDTNGVDLASHYFRALAGNPEAALQILQQHPELLFHERFESYEQFTSAVDAMLGALADHVRATGSFEDAAMLGAILDTLALDGAEDNRDAVAAAIETVLPVLVEGIASGDIATGDIDAVATLAGDLVQRYLDIRAGDDPQRCQEAMAVLLQGLASRIEFTPESYGAVSGLLIAGMLKHFDRIHASDEDRNAIIGGLATTASALSGGSSSPWGVALSVTFEGAAALYLGANPPRDYEAFAREFQGTVEYGILTDQMLEGGQVSWSDAQAGTAIDWMNAMIHLNGE